MTYSLEIPGQISEHQLKAIELIAKNAYQGTTFVELGSLFGRSSYAWAKSSEERSQIYCIDPFSGNKGIKHMADSLGITYSLETFLNYTKDCHNIKVIQGYSPKVVEETWSKPIHLYFDDSVHQNPGFINNLTFWRQHLVEGGILCGDDYRPRFQDIIKEVNQLEIKNYNLFLIDFMWILLPEKSNYFDIPNIRKSIGILGKKAENSRIEFKAIHPEGKINILEDSKIYEISFRFSNMSKEPIEIQCLHGDEQIEYSLDKPSPITFDIPTIIKIKTEKSNNHPIKMKCRGTISNNIYEHLLFEPIKQIEKTEAEV